METTTLSTLSLLEARLLRIEHLLYGPSATPSLTARDDASTSLDNLERRFTSLLSRVRAYGELMKLYRSHPTLFQPAQPNQIPTQLPPEAVRATVLASASAFSSTASSLTAVTDSPVPESSLSASLAALLPRMRGIEVTQLAQAAELAELRAQSEQVLRQWYEGGVLEASQFVSDVEGRVEMVERQVRRAERERDDESVL